MILNYSVTVREERIAQKNASPSRKIVSHRWQAGCGLMSPSSPSLVGARSRLSAEGGARWLAGRMRPPRSDLVSQTSHSDFACRQDSRYNQENWASTLSDLYNLETWSCIHTVMHLLHLFGH